MSVRSSARLRAEQPDEIKETDAAPIAPVSTRRATRKRDADDEPQKTEDATPAAAAAASASSVPDSKRPRRSSRVRQSASAATEEKDAAAAGDGRKVPRSAGAERDEGSAAEINGQQGTSNEGNADAVMAYASGSSLDSLRVATAGHLFSAATVTGRPALPLLAVARVCDFLTAADIVLCLAPAARASYATAVEYAQMVAQSVVAASEAEVTPAGSKKQSSRKRGGGGKAAAATVVAEPFSSAPTAAGNSVDRRSEVTVFTSVRALTLLCTSRLRAIVSGIHTRSADKEVLPLNARLLNRVGEAIPTLTSLQCPLASSGVEPTFFFPVGLRELHLSLLFFIAPRISEEQRDSRVTKPAQSWSEAQCDTFAEWCVAKAATLPNLTTLTLSTCNWPHRLRSWNAQCAASPKRSWIEPLMASSSLRNFTCELRSTAAWSSTVRRLVQLESFSGTLVRKSPAAIFHKLHHFKKLKRIPLEHVQLSPELLMSLQRVSRSLTDLRPHSLANVTDVTFLHDFAQLRHLNLFEQGPRPSYYSYSPVTYTQGATAPTAQHIVETIESLSFARRAKIESIGVGSDSWTSELLQRLLPALPTLTRLEVHSKAITSLAVLSSVDSLRLSLKVLRLRTPSVPRDDVSHLLSLRQLDYLSIEGSFSEPLFAKQLFPFLPPYPKQPLHWLRLFVPRSDDEPVPTPPVDPAAKATADAEFDARVRAGGVCAAELLNSAQLSGVMQFLDMKDFSIAARTCRSWRAAACLPSAWSLSSPVVVGDDEVAADPLVNGVSPPQWFGSEVFSFDGHGRLMPPKLKARNSRSRTLHLSASQPHCCPSVLPGLPLWLNAQSVALKSSATRDYPYSEYAKPQILESDQQALLAIQQLPRLESLATAVDLRSETAITVLMHMGHKLRSLEVIGLPTSLLGVSALTELRVSDGRINGELSVLHQLRRVSLIRCKFGANAGTTLRMLSRDHALRELNLEGGDFTVLLSILAGEAVTIPPPVAALAEALMIEWGLALVDNPPTNVPSSPPALLERLRIARPESSSLSDVIHLPRLRQLEIQCDGAGLDLSSFATSTRDGGLLPPMEILILTSPSHGALDFVEMLTDLRELRLSAPHVRRWNHSELPGSADSNPRWAQKLIALKRLEVIVLNGVQIDPIDVASLDQLPKLRVLSLNRQQSLRVSDLAVLPRIRGLTELQLDHNPQLLLQKRDWLKDLGRQLPGESAVAAVEASAEAAAQSMQDVEEQKGDTEAESAPAASAAAASSGPSLPADADGMLPLLLQCRSLRVLRWRSSFQHLEESERYTSRHSWVRPAPRLRTSVLQQHRINKEYARERQALRMLLSANPLLSVEVGVRVHAYSAPSIRNVVLPPRSGSIAEAEVTATAESARKLGSSYEYDKVVSSNPSLQAYEDRALLSIEREEELEWRADAEQQAAAKPKRRNKY